VHRITLLIAPDGSVARVWPKVTPTGHAAEVLAEITARS
jgi:peroxiredoxin Q/BCP